ncbi:hypothetical protein [Shewanella colwelliana]|nr:hypothetical protein [Shewanella colwelliana]
MATTLALLLPFILLSISSITNMMLYGYSVPLHWLLIAATPLLVIAYKIRITQTEDKLVINRSLFDFSLYTKSFTLKKGDVVQWCPGQKKGSYKLTINKQNIGLFVDK